MKSFLIAAIFLSVVNISAEEVTLAWDRNTERDVNGYTLYYGLASGNYTHNQDAGNNTLLTIYNMEKGKKYYFAVTARIESDYSDEINYVIPNPIIKPTCGHLSCHQ